MSRHHRRKHRFKLKSFYVWHRYMGVTAALFMLLVAVTGIPINHTDSFRLDSRFVTADAILSWYGIQAPDSLLSFPAGQRPVTLMGDRLYLGKQKLTGSFHHLAGAIAVDSLLMIAVDDRILLLTREGELIETLGQEDGIPTGIKQTGVDPQGALVIDSGDEIYSSNNDFLSWQHWTGNKQSIQWARPVGTDAVLKKSLQQQYRGEVLPMERLLLDLHSGRFFGPAGPWLMDAAAVLLLLLSLTGLWMWFKRRR